LQIFPILPAKRDLGRAPGSALLPMHSPAALHSTSPLDVLHPKPPCPLPAVETPSAFVQAISTCPQVWVPLSTMTLAQAASIGRPGLIRATMKSFRILALVAQARRLMPGTFISGPL